MRRLHLTRRPARTKLGTPAIYCEPCMQACSPECVADERIRRLQDRALTFLTLR